MVDSHHTTTFSVTDVDLLNDFVTNKLFRSVDLTPFDHRFDVAPVELRTPYRAIVLRGHAHVGPVYPVVDDIDSVWHSLLDVSH